MERIIHTTPWRTVERADTRTGLLPFVRQVETDRAPLLWKQIDLALLASPWPEA